MSIKNLLFSFDGRINRLKYAIIILPLNFIFILMNNLAKYNPDFDIIFLPFYILFGYITFALMIKRLHDLNKSGWMSLIGLIPILNIVFGFYLLFAKGTKGVNQYGDDPLQNNITDTKSINTKSGIYRNYNDKLKEFFYNLADKFSHIDIENYMKRVNYSHKLGNDYLIVNKIKSFLQEKGETQLKIELSEIIVNYLNSKELLTQFVLEELDSASAGNFESMSWAKRKEYKFDFKNATKQFDNRISYSSIEEKYKKMDLIDKTTLVLNIFQDAISNIKGGLDIKFRMDIVDLIIDKYL